MPFRTKSAPRRVAETIRKRVHDNPRATAAAAAAGVVAAAAAGFAAVRQARTHANGRTLHVLAVDGEGWVVTRDGGEPLDHFDSKREAVAVAKELARSARPTTLSIHRRDGKVSRTHTYQAD
jgi:hypothetical protein